MDRNRTDTVTAKISHLILHERDERRHYKGNPTKVKPAHLKND